MSLRQLVKEHPEDAQTIYNLIAFDPDHLRQFDDTTADKYQSVEDVLESIEEPENPNKLRFGIWDGDTMVGSINLTPHQDCKASVGYWVGKEHIGHGHAAEAVRLLSDYAFNQAGYEKLVAAVRFGNLASRKTLENAGYQYTRDNSHGTDWILELNKVSDGQQTVVEEAGLS